MAHLRLAYLSNIALGIRSEDARAALQAWCDQMHLRMGTCYDGKVVPFDNLSQLEEAVRNGQLGMVALSTREFLSTRDRLNLVPWTVTVMNDAEAGAYALVVRRDSGIDSVEKMQGRRLTIAPADRGMIPETWLDLELMRRGLAGTREYFGEVTTVSRPERAVLGLFFGRDDVALVRGDVLRRMVEQNPQIGEAVRVIDRSPSCVHRVFCLRSGLSEEVRRDMDNVTLHMHEWTEGVQALQLLRADRIVHYQPELIEPAERLFREYGELAATADPEGKRLRDWTYE